jgi:RNA polymerase sigma factor (sigma-70 family)
LSKPDPTIEQLYRLHAPAAFRRARRILGDEADAHEVVQDVFVSLLQQPEQYSGKSSLATFLYSAVTHACLNRIRNRRTRERLGAHESSATSRSQPLNAEEQLALHSALRELPEQLAQVAVYFYMDELTHDEIARVIGCSRRQVGKLLERISSHPAHKELSQCS